ncbi:hypothetical protein M426DRAFT_263555 [Hypoxylon sp. CI-4A]|nr:hypothetical protein M426DRAFT_263555 [Hypoxylon sp. CI-4A]
MYDTSWSICYLPFIAIVVGYLTLVRHLRYRRKESIEARFLTRPLSSMTTKEAHEIIAQLQELEFPYAFAKARRIALLKAGGIPTMSKLFAATGQNTRRNAGKRSVDTEILLRESQSKFRDSDRYATAVARMNYLHSRYRRANKITDPDLLHTLGDGLAEILTVVGRDEWRQLTDAEKCAVGVFHKNLGEDMRIPLDPLPSSASGVYVDSAVSTLPDFVRTALRATLGADLDDVMRTSLNLETPGFILSSFLTITRNIRILYLRHLALPRPSSRPVKLVDETPNAKTRLYNFGRKGLQPWYVKPTFWSKWGPLALLVRAMGGKAPGTRGERYQPHGYDLMTIGPEPQKGKGLEDMITDAEVIKAKGVATCPFSQGKFSIN